MNANSCSSCGMCITTTRMGSVLVSQSLGGFCQWLPRELRVSVVLHLTPVASLPVPCAGNIPVNIKYKVLLTVAELHRQAVATVKPNF